MVFDGSDNATVHFAILPFARITRELGRAA
jgi:hypothetical protein